MIYTEQAIQKAKNANWNDNRDVAGPYESNPIRIDEIAFMSPLFWMALGKSLGWTGLYKDYDRITKAKNWLNIWHDFIDHLSNGGTAEDFFKSLLAK